MAGLVAGAATFVRERPRAKDRAGFIVNVCGCRTSSITVRLFDDGSASLEDIDTAVRLGLSHPMGLLALLDLIGLDPMLSVGEVLDDEFRDERYAPPPLLPARPPRLGIGRRLLRMRLKITGR